MTKYLHLPANINNIVKGNNILNTIVTLNLKKNGM